MSKKGTIAIHDQFIAIFDEACIRLDDAVEDCGPEQIVVLARALEKNGSATLEELAKLWKEELDEPVNLEVIGLAVAMRSKLGPEWHVIFQADGFAVGRDDDDAIQQAREYWKDEFAEFDLARKRDAALVKRWLKRKMRKAA